MREETLDRRSTDDVLVRAKYSGVSRGTEALVFSGRVPASEYARMRAPFQTGEFPGPVKYGYSSVGEVEDGPDDLRGRTVFVLHPHQTRYVVPAGAVHVVPDDVPPRRAILAASLETAVNGVWDARLQVGDRVVVIGAGVVGCLVAWLAARVPGVEVQLVDLNPSRERVARALGVPFGSPTSIVSDPDLVVHASGSGSGLEAALAAAGFETTIVDLSWYGTERVTLPLGEAFHSKRLTLKSSQVGHVAAPRRSRWDRRRRMELTLRLLADPRLDVAISGESAFEDLPTVMPQLAAASGETLCHCIRY
jgi:threonine dehydrogenase-like Zn-dependent dehydrogenase